MSATLKPFEASVEMKSGRVRYFVVYAVSIQEAYQNAAAQLTDGELMRGVNPLDND